MSCQDKWPECFVQDRENMYGHLTMKGLWFVHAA